jgi:hypothetical protein
MRKLFTFLAAGALVVGLSAQSQANPISPGSSLVINLLGNVLGTVANGTETGNASSDTSATLGAGSAFAGFVSTSFVANATQPVSAIYVYVQNNAAGNFTGGVPGTVGGAALFTGMATVFVGGGALAVIPLAIGAPGVNFVTVTKKGACTFCLTAIGASWTAGTGAITNVATSLGGPLQNITVMGNNALSPGGNGVLTLVSPSKVITNLTGPIPLVSVLTLNYVPEPGTLLLLGAGVAGLAALGRKRTRA